MLKSIQTRLLMPQRPRRAMIFGVNLWAPWRACSIRVLGRFLMNKLLSHVAFAFQKEIEMKSHLACAGTESVEVALVWLAQAGSEKAADVAISRPLQWISTFSQGRLNSTSGSF